MLVHIMGRDSDACSARRLATVGLMTREADPAPAGVKLFDSPEEAALAGWRSTPAAHARVEGVEPSEIFDGVYVTVQHRRSSRIS